MKKLSRQQIKNLSFSLNFSDVQIYTQYVLSEKFLDKHADKVCWDYISKYQKLSEEFIEKHSDKVNWWNISQYQKLSEEFIKKHPRRIYWNFLLKNKKTKLSKQFIIKFINKFSSQDLDIKFNIIKKLTSNSKYHEVFKELIK